jgi:hypothetical protein
VASLRAAGMGQHAMRRCLCTLSVPAFSVLKGLVLIILNHTPNEE